MPFTKGDPNINMKGRPKKFTIHDYVTSDDVQELLKVALDLAKKGNTDMVKYVLDHSLGKAPQNINVGGQDGMHPILVKFIDGKEEHKDNNNTEGV